MEARDEACYVKIPDGRVLAIGGTFSYLGDPLSWRKSVEAFDPKSGTWFRVASTNARFMYDLRCTVLPDGRVLLVDDGDAEAYDPAADKWTTIERLKAPEGSPMTVLPNGEILFTGGFDRLSADAVKASARSMVFDLQPGTMRAGAALRAPRFYHKVMRMQNGAVLLLGGEGGTLEIIEKQLSTRQVIDTVESFAWEPSLRVTLDQGFYVAAASLSAAGDRGFWGLEVKGNEPFHGGLNAGGLLDAGGQEVAFAAFYLAKPQQVRITVNLQNATPLPGPLEASLTLLDQDRKPVGSLTGVGNLVWSQDLQPGFWILELRSSSRAPAATYQLAASVPLLEPGVFAGAVLDPSVGAPGFLAFYLPARQDVSLRLFNQNTYGWPPGAGEVVLTLLDAQGRVIRRVGPGLMQAAP